MTTGQWRQQGFEGGMSIDDFLGTKGSFLFAKNIDIRSHPSSVQLASEVDNVINYIEDTGDNKNTINDMYEYISVGENGEIRLGADADLAVPDGGVTLTTDDLVNVTEYNDWVIAFGSTKIHRFQKTGTLITAFEADYKSFTDNHAFRVSIEVNNNLYIAGVGGVHELSSAGVLTENKLRIFGTEQVVGLEYNGQQIKVYTRDRERGVYGAAYWWDPSKDAYSHRAVLQGQIIQASTSLNATDYIIAGRTEPTLYKVQGYQFVPIKQLPVALKNQDIEINPNAMRTYNGLIHIGYCLLNGSGALTGPTSNGDFFEAAGLWTFGSKNASFDDVLVLEYECSDKVKGSTDIEIRSIGLPVNAGDGVRFAWKNTQDNRIGIDKVDPDRYADVGHIVSRVHDGGDSTTSKEITRLALSHAKLLDGEDIELSLRKDDVRIENIFVDTFETTEEMGIDSSDDGMETTFRVSDDAADIGSYNFLQTVTRLSSGSNTVTPRVIDILIDYETTETTQEDLG